MTRVGGAGRARRWQTRTRVRRTLFLMEFARDTADLDRFLGAARAPTVCVPTMGALHKGHEALIRRGVAEANHRGISGGCSVTIFVNPTQFNDPVDYERYARTLDADLGVCRTLDVSLVFAPSVEVIYPPDEVVAVPAIPAVATEPGLEDAGRPGHFAGVCQVIKRLFEILRPAAAVFGEKDWQQLRVVSAMVAQLSLGVEIIPLPTVREADGLALSSRNAFLSPGERRRALCLSEALREGGRCSSPLEAERIMHRVLGGRGIDPEYAVVRDAATLLTPGPAPKRALISAVVGGVRLLDNAPWPSDADG